MATFLTHRLPTMVLRYISKLILRGKLKLSRIEQHLVGIYTKGPKDPKRLALLNEALRPTLAKQVELLTSSYIVKAPAEDVVTVIAIITAIRFNAERGQNIRNFFYEIKTVEIPVSMHLLDSNGYYVNIPQMLTYLKEELSKLLDFYNDASKTTDTDISNRRQLEQNFDIFHNYIDDLVSAINQQPVYLHAT